MRVLDLSTVIAGPNCGKYFADFGADVIKVESPAGDSLRKMAWRDPRDGEGLWSKVLNRGKRTVVLDLKQADDADVLRRLVVDADVLIENFRPGTLDRLGFAPATLPRDQPTAGHHPDHRVRAGRAVRVAARASPRSPSRCPASPRSPASPTGRRCCRRSR